METDKKKGQVVSFDFSMSFIVFIVFLVVIIFLIFYNNSSEKDQEFEMDYIFANFENNLMHDMVPGQDFYSNYRINKTKLDVFPQLVSIDSYVVGNINDAHGIGLDEAAYDVCLYFINNTNQHLRFGAPAIVALGQLEGTDCNSKISAGQNPCEGYSEAISFFQPVLFDVGDSTKNSIIQMNLVMCKK